MYPRGSGPHRFDGEKEENMVKRSLFRKSFYPAQQYIIYIHHITSVCSFSSVLQYSVKTEPIVLQSVS